MLQHQYVGGKTLKTTNKLAGPVGKEGVLDGINRWRNAGKNTKKHTWICHKMSYFQAILGGGEAPHTPHFANLT